jgi:hypothetical protein
MGNKNQSKSREEAEGSYRFSHLGCSARLYVVVMFDLWEVHCLRVMHTNRDGGWFGAGLIFGVHFPRSERRQAEDVFSFVSA